MRQYRFVTSFVIKTIDHETKNIYHFNDDY